ncbi:MAG: RNase H family protein, partial [Candidatus Nitrosocaldus sp.]
MSIYLYVDGASKGNPGDAAIGLIVKDCNGNVLRKYKEYIGVATNNMAEYTARKKGLEMAAVYGKDITVMMDSRLMGKQMRKEYK